ncbi:NAD(P)H-binding protein [Myroides pelagicus]|uniref:NAD(P)H-binding protein n=1 Tax=Myroides pelagicus TaxID=270914 RepID=A0A7K1GJ09_9FLAO|nr:NAD(P)H-binding protein [Myroides pelagicus]MEC4113675.1 NAD(P)H-binding protein [Myroides pelagicus]MTH28871.1 NAD(P)H-binding protein [Myroides pelagicus]
MRTIGILGCGWLGLPLAVNLKQQGYNIKGSTTTLEKLTLLEEVGIDSYLINLNSQDYLEPLLAFLENIDSLIITIPPSRKADNNQYVTTFNKIIHAIETTAIKQLIMTSSVSVYAPSNKTITDTSTNYSSAPTAVHIRAIEEALLSQNTFHTTILRLGGLYSEDRRPVVHICKRETFDNPDLPVNMAHQTDIINFISKLLTKENYTDEIYNIVSPNFANRLDYYSEEANKYRLTLPPLGKNNLEEYKKVDGTRISRLLDTEYQF